MSAVTLSMKVSRLLRTLSLDTVRLNLSLKTRSSASQVKTEGSIGGIVKPIQEWNHGSSFTLPNRLHRGDTLDVILDSLASHAEDRLFLLNPDSLSTQVPGRNDGCA